MAAKPLLLRRAFLHTAAMLFAAAIATPASAHGSAPRSTLAEVDIFDRTTGTSLPVYPKDGRYYVVGQPGHEYTIRIRNRSAGRILAVTSVDGVNVVTGDTASPEQSGYVIDGWGTVEIGGWRKSLSRTATFFFTEHSASYAARTGRPFDVGVIGVAVFAEKPQPAPQRIDEPLRAPSADASAAAPATPQEGENKARAEAQEAAAATRARPAPTQPLARLGTGHGCHEVSHARQVAFRRATTAPAEIIAIEYDRRENLAAMGVLPPEQLADRRPRPFPGLRFVPDPR